MWNRRYQGNNISPSHHHNNVTLTVKKNLLITVPTPIIISGTWISVVQSSFSVFRNISKIELSSLECVFFFICKLYFNVTQKFLSLNNQMIKLKKILFRKIQFCVIVFVRNIILTIVFVVSLCYGNCGLVSREDEFNEVIQD